MKQITLYIRDDQFEKLENQKNKSETVREALDLYYSQEKTKTGIVYSIKNIENSKKYIGSTTNINQRLDTHLRQLNNGSHHNKELQSDWGKYPSDKFKIIIIESGLGDDEAKQKEKTLIKKEDNIYNSNNLKPDKENDVLGLVSQNPFLSLNEIANQTGCDENYVRTILNKNGLTLGSLREDFAEKATKLDIKLDLDKLK